MHYKSNSTYMVIILSLLCLNLGCSKQTSSSSKPVVQKVEVFGDPNELYSGATTNANSFFTTTNLASQNANLKFINYFFEAVPTAELAANSTNASVATHTQTEHIHHENGISHVCNHDHSSVFASHENFELLATTQVQNAMSSENSSGPATFNLTGPYSDSAGTYYVYYSSQFGLAFKFAQQAGQLVLTGLFEGTENGNIEYPAQAIHYSRTPDNKFFSILISTNLTTYKRALIVAYFSQDATTGTQATRTTNQNQYEYLYDAGAGRLVGWDPAQNLKISICGDEAKKQSAIITESVNNLKATLAGRLNISVETPLIYPPFTDVNTKCVFASKSYLFKIDTEGLVLGLTMSADGVVATANNTLTQRIRGGSVILFGGNIDDFLGNENDPVIKYIVMKFVVLHELGHLIGLGHKFSPGLEYGDPGYVPSIMSYDFETDLQDYDIKALQLLYPTM